MRGFSAALILSGLVSVAAVSQAYAEPYSEVTGNWAGASLGGFYFRATLEQNEDAGALKIWNAMDAVPDGKAEPELNVPRFVLLAFATDQHLEVEDGHESAVLKVVSAYADEVGTGTVQVSLQYIDNQFTIIGYEHRGEEHIDGGKTSPHSCLIDFEAGKVTQDGQTRDLPAMDFEARNASAWTETAPYDRGWCATSDEPG